jgi:hypothetical protein
LLEDGDVGVGIFPEGEEGVVGGAGFGRVADEGIGAGETEMGQRADGFVGHHATPIQDFLKLGGGLWSLMSSEKSLASNIDGIEVGPEGGVPGIPSSYGAATASA